MVGQAATADLDKIRAELVLVHIAVRFAFPHLLPGCLCIAAVDHIKRSIQRIPCFDRHLLFNVLGALNCHRRRDEKTFVKQLVLFLFLAVVHGKTGKLFELIGERHEHSKRNQLKHRMDNGNA